MVYKKGDDVVKPDGTEMRCVCCDEEVAIFGEKIEEDGDVIVSYEGLEAYSNALDMNSPLPSSSHFYHKRRRTV